MCGGEKAPLHLALDPSPAVPNTGGKKPLLGAISPLPQSLFSWSASQGGGVARRSPLLLAQVQIEGFSAAGS